MVSDVLVDNKLRKIFYVLNMKKGTTHASKIGLHVLKGNLVTVLG